MDLIPFDDRDGFIWFDGQMVPWREAKLHVLTHGLHYASSVFEGERAYHGRVFKLREHSERLIHSARLLDFDLPYTAEQLDAATMEVVRANNITDGYIRPVAWRGSEMMAVGAQKSKAHVAIAAWVWPNLFHGMKEEGARLTVSQWARPAPNTAPTASKAAGLYMIATLSKHQAERAGFHDALMLDWQGNLAEATGANMFLVIDGELHTPTPVCFLDGITRRTVMDIARGQGRTVVERTMAPTELARAQEVFLCGTAAEITPVREIDGNMFQIGRVTRDIMQAYHDLVRCP